MRRRATRTWAAVLLSGLLAAGAAGSAAAARPERDQVGDVPVCRIERDGRQRTALVPPSKVQDKLDKDLQRGECPHPSNGRVMCKIEGGRKIKNVLVRHSEVNQQLKRGWTLGVCGPG